MNLVPTNSETIAVIINPSNAALKTPWFTGILVFSEIFLIMSEICSFDNDWGIACILPELFTKICFPGPGHSML